jgi:hypothetical protein
MTKISWSQNSCEGEPRSPKPCPDQSFLVTTLVRRRASLAEAGCLTKTSWSPHSCEGEPCSPIRSLPSHPESKSLLLIHPFLEEKIWLLPKCFGKQGGWPMSVQCPVINPVFENLNLSPAQSHSSSLSKGDRILPNKHRN